ncbi:hypothetical protein DEW08_11645 [Azospirillum thermophilum]|uniref:DUF1289 domain-containing protein n=1 Tax=Azospirillum thermophilum TaxID=2202148 RepID=A0A2S2CQL8_9PROT|nr:hypothetical protein DEW08_11645 [Azospirillum thermophilum]
MRSPGPAGTAGPRTEDLMSDDPDCLGMCAIDGEVCTGCGRTLDQINAARDEGGVDEEPAA